MSDLRFIRNQVAATRHEQRNGREFLVVPVVAVVEGILNGEFLSAEEIGKTPLAWNGRPLVIGHPPADNGIAGSANDQETLDKIQLGVLYNTTWMGGKLRTEAWIDLLQAKEKGGDHVIAVKRLEAGELTDVSTAYFRDREDNEGEFQGEPFDGIQRNIVPDHLALLLDEPGACSIDDGCGAPRLNSEEGDTMQGNVIGKARRPTFEGTTDAPWEKPTLAQFIRAAPGDTPDDADVADLPTAVKNWIAAHALLGDPDADNQRDLTFFAVVGTDGRLNAGALRAVLGGRGAQADIPEAARNSAQAEARALLDAEFEASNEPSKNCVQRAAEMILNRIEIAFGNRAGGTMTKAEMIEKLVADEKFGLTAEELDPLADSALEKLVAQLDSDNQDDEEDEDHETPDTEQNDDETPTTNQQELPEGLQRLAVVFEKPETVDALAALLTTNQQANTDQRAALVGELATNAACRFSKEQLEAWTIADLQTLQRSLITPNYSGQGDPVPAGQGEEYALSPML